MTAISRSRLFMPRLPRGPLGFTLIEVLVVVAIIALLISILLPSLKQAREQAKVAVCLSNLSTIGKAGVAYMHGNRDQYAWGNGRRRTDPTTPIDENTTEPYLRTWGYGGNRGTLGDPSAFYVDTSDWRPTERPLNRYVYAAKLGDETKLPVFQCPSDKGVRLNTDASSNSTFLSAYQLLGTSYQANHNWRYYSIDQESLTSRRRWELLRNITRIMEKHSPSRYILLYEDPADWALTTADDLPPQYRVSSWHGRSDVHSLLFMDGHAANLLVTYMKNSYLLKRSGASNWIARQDWRED